MAKKKGKYYEKLPNEGKQTVDNFAKNLELFFPTQADAEKVLLYTQPMISRYASGSIPIPKDVAERFSEYTDGVVKVEDIYFDSRKYFFEQKQAESEIA